VGVGLDSIAADFVDKVANYEEPARSWMNDNPGDRDIARAHVYAALALANATLAAGAMARAAR